MERTARALSRSFRESTAGAARGSALIVALGVFLSAAVAACSPAASGAQSEPRLSVLASFYPLHEVAARVGGERVEAGNLVAVGDEAHDLELSARDVERMRQARLVVYLGEGFQPGLERALAVLDAPQLVALDVAEGLALLESEHGHAHAHEDDEHAEHDEHANGHDEREAHGSEEHATDPHLWLDPLLMMEVTARVRDALIDVDPDGRAVYESNAREYTTQLGALHDELERGLKDCQRRELVVAHAAFGYLAQRYGLEQEPIAGLSPEIEPSAQRMQEIIHFAREHDVTTIYFETLVSPRVAETIAREIGATTMVLNPIEGLTADEQADGKTYFDLMHENLANLRAGLECS